MSHRPVKSDPQRHRVYAWEDGYDTGTLGDMGTKRFYALLRDVCQYYRVKRPRSGVLSKRQQREHLAALCDTDNNALWFSPKYCTARVLLHELAHWVFDGYGFTGAPHQALWLGIYIHMLDKWFVCPVEASVASARTAGCDFVDPRQCTPTLLRKKAKNARS